MIYSPGWRQLPPLLLTRPVQRITILVILCSTLYWCLSCSGGLKLLLSTFWYILLHSCPFCLRKRAQFIKVRMHNKCTEGMRTSPASTIATPLKCSLKLSDSSRHSSACTPPYKGYLFSSSLPQCLVSYTNVTKPKEYELKHIVLHAYLKPNSVDVDRFTYLHWSVYDWQSVTH